MKAEGLYQIFIFAMLSIAKTGNRVPDVDFLCYAQHSVESSTTNLVQAKAQSSKNFCCAINGATAKPTRRNPTR